jgi:exodeoxyribonuclease V alpha subunit
MQIENDYDKEVYNGDIGYIDDVDPNAGEIVASFDGAKTSRVAGNATAASIASINRSRDSHAAI